MDLSSWHFVVDGLVEHPLTLSYADLQAYPRIETAANTGVHRQPGRAAG